ncbi:hypothetical protein [Roseomonas harenae]|uniref:hypothetical protein n=1 Tax=Muricoccus harenae TaxID=2692566 RepID=UPI001331AF86|nr:hypothetical protein [Roseomonas harenae]
MIESFLLGTGSIGWDPVSLSWLRVGACLDLCPRGRSRVEVRSPDGRPLGWLPSEDAQAITGLIHSGAVRTARVRGVIPAFGRARVQLAIEVQEDRRPQ